MENWGEMVYQSIYSTLLMVLRLFCKKIIKRQDNIILKIGSTCSLCEFHYSIQQTFYRGALGVIQ